MKRSLFLFILITVCLSLFRLDSFTLFDVDEAVFSEATREMVDSGNWLTPTYNGENRYDKPILFYWLMALSYKIFGVNEFGARFPSALAAVLLALSLFFFVKRFCDEEYAFHAGLSFVLSLYFVAYSHSAVTDMTLALFITLSLFSFYASTTAPPGSGKNAALFTYAFYFFSALAFLTKGLIGVVFPFGIAIVYIDITEGWRHIKKIFNVKGIFIFLAVSAPWYIAQFMVNGQEFIDKFFIKHHVRRYLEVISGHSGPLYYFIPLVLIGLFPWIVFFASGIRNAFAKTDRLGTFSLIWFTFIFVFFSLSTTKLPNYILPAVPAASILIASGMSVQNGKWTRYSHLFLVLLTVIAGGGLILLEKNLFKLGISDTRWIWVLAALAAVMAIIGIYAFLRRKTAHYPLALLMIVFLAVLLIKAVPLANEYMQGTLHTYSIYAKHRLQKNEELFVYGINNPSIVFYSGRKIVTPRTRIDLAAEVENSGHAIAIVKPGNVRALNASGLRILEKGEKYAILEK